MGSKTQGFKKLLSRTNTWTKQQTMDAGLKTDDIVEKTVDNGIDIDSVIIKDEGINFPTSDSRLHPSGALIKLKTIDETSYKSIDVNEMRSWGAVRTRYVYEVNADQGVTVDGLTIKDEGIEFPTTDIVLYSDTVERLIVKNVARTSMRGLMGGILTAISQITSNTINEYGSGSGVSIDGTLIKDDIIGAVGRLLYTHPAENPPSEAVNVDAGGTTNATYDGSANSWTQIADVVYGIILDLSDFEVNSDSIFYDLLFLLTVFKITFPSVGYALGGGSSTYTIQWEYSIDGGASYTIVSTETVGTGDGNTASSNVSFDASDITGDVMIKLRVWKPTGVDGDSFDLASHSVTISASLKGD